MLNYYIALTIFIQNLVTGNLVGHDFKMTYDNVNEQVVMSCKVPKD